MITIPYSTQAIQTTGPPSQVRVRTPVAPDPARDAQCCTKTHTIWYYWFWRWKIYKHCQGHDGPWQWIRLGALRKLRKIRVIIVVVRKLSKSKSHLIFWEHYNILCSWFRGPCVTNPLSRHIRKMSQHVQCSKCSIRIILRVIATWSQCGSIVLNSNRAEGRWWR